ncbi:MAG: hypothetical protein ACXAEI_05985 [Candidatus Hodarchaeales archaeon]
MSSGKVGAFFQWGVGNLIKWYGEDQGVPRGCAKDDSRWLPLP